MSGVLTHQIPLRGGTVIATAELPADLTADEAARLTALVRLLVVPAVARRAPGPRRGAYGRRYSGAARAEAAATAARLHDGGLTLREIAPGLGVSYQTVANLIAEHEAAR
jgi:DNA-binding transcriptional regulator LsrR (DeoR family)